MTKRPTRSASALAARLGGRALWAVPASVLAMMLPMAEAGLGFNRLARGGKPAVLGLGLVASNG